MSVANIASKVEHTQDRAQCNRVDTSMSDSLDTRNGTVLCTGRVPSHTMRYQPIDFRAAATTPKKSMHVSVHGSKIRIKFKNQVELRRVLTPKRQQAAPASRRKRVQKVTLTLASDPPCTVGASAPPTTMPGSAQSAAPGPLTSQSAAETMDTTASPTPCDYDQHSTSAEQAADSASTDDDCVIIEPSQTTDQSKKSSANHTKSSTTNLCDDDDDCVIVSEKGDVALRTFSHTRSTCIEHPFEFTKESIFQSTSTETAVGCAKCYCEVCDKPTSECNQQIAHFRSTQKSFFYKKVHAELRRLSDNARDERIAAARTAASSAAATNTPIGPSAAPPPARDQRAQISAAVGMHTHRHLAIQTQPGARITMNATPQRPQATMHTSDPSTFRPNVTLGLQPPTRPIASRPQPTARPVASTRPRVSPVLPLPPLSSQAGASQTGSSHQSTTESSSSHAANNSIQTRDRPPTQSLDFATQEPTQEPTQTSHTYNFWNVPTSPP